ncbi:MAG: nucleoside diphosphate kinase regulator [Candidatus Aminicenantales bacterium]
MAKKVTLTKADYERLMALVSVDLSPQDPDAGSIRELRTELERAVIVESGKIGADIVTMNSRVRIQDLDTGEQKEYTLVYPLAADFSQGKISVLVPLGTALIGFRTGDVVEGKVPGGIRKFKIKKILYQPEAAGDFNS